MDRLTKKIRGGCVCYAAFFDVNGAPTAPQAYPEDQIWYALTNEEQESIRHAKWSRGDHDHARPDYWPTARSFLRASELAYFLNGHKLNYIGAIDLAFRRKGVPQLCAY